MAYGVWMSLQNVDVVRGTSRFIGLGNYLQLFQDPQFGLSVLNTAWYTLTVVPLIVAGSIAIAVFLRESRPARLVGSRWILYSLCFVTGGGRHLLEMAFE